MINLNGDICRQLTNIYGVYFKPKYKKEIKERLIFISNSLLRNITLDQLNSFSDLFEINKNKITILKEKFLIINRDEILNSFNTIWLDNNKLIYKSTLKEGMYFRGEILIQILEEIKDFLKNNNITYENIKSQTGIQSYKNHLFIFEKKANEVIFKYNQKFKFRLLKSDVLNLSIKFDNYFLDKINKNDYIKNFDFLNKNSDDIINSFNFIEGHYKFEVFDILVYKLLKEKLKELENYFL